MSVKDSMTGVAKNLSSRSSATANSSRGLTPSHRRRSNYDSRKQRSRYPTHDHECPTSRRADRPVGDRRAKEQVRRSALTRCQSMGRPFPGRARAAVRGSGQRSISRNSSTAAIRGRLIRRASLSDGGSSLFRLQAADCGCLDALLFSSPPARPSFGAASPTLRSA